jgi:transcriptional regulator with XRE-family HTH domain
MHVVLRDALQPMAAPEPGAYAARLLALLEEHGWTQEELASRAGITYNTVNRILNGRSLEPQTTTKTKIAQAFGLKPWEVEGRPAPESDQLNRIEDRMAGIEGQLDRLTEIFLKAQAGDREGFLRLLEGLAESPNRTNGDTP